LLVIGVGGKRGKLEKLAQIITHECQDNVDSGQFTHPTPAQQCKLA